MTGILTTGKIKSVKYNNIFKITFGVLLLLVISLYLGIICVLPSIINSKTSINKLQSFLHNKTGIETTVAGLNLKISPKLVAVLRIDSLDAKNDNVSVADIKNFAVSYELLQRHLTLVSADNIYIDGNCLKQFKKEGRKKKRGSFFCFSFCPYIFNRPGK